jgi:acyl-CoA thioesterase-2
MTTDAATLPLAEAILNLEQIGERRFRSTYNQDNYLGMIFGGQPLGQALAAAQHTVAAWPAHSLSGYFIRGGAVDEPVDYEVEVVRDGRRFAFRRVLATQKGKPIFDMLCSFHAEEVGPEHQFGDLSDVPDPESLTSVSEFVAANTHRLSRWLVESYRRGWPFELRLADPETSFFTKPEISARDFWFRMPTATSIEDSRDHHSLLAFMSDYWFAGVASSVHTTTAKADRLSVASLNHAMWIHAPVRVDEWLLFRTESPWGGAGRGVARGLIYDRSGQQIATVVQEIAMRVVQPDEG